MTLLEVLQSTTAYFQKRGIESPRLNAEHLVADVLKMSRLELYLEFETKLNETELAQLRELVKRRGQGEPLQHLLGTVEFCGQTFLCDKRAMVPRPETEELVELLKSEIRNPKSEIAGAHLGPLPEYRERERRASRLRVGYVSPDWAGHPVARFMQPILESHDRDAFEIHVYDDAGSIMGTHERKGDFHEAEYQWPRYCCAITKVDAGCGA